MSKTLQSILGGRNLTGVIQGIRPGLPEGVFPPGLTTPTPRTVEGDYGTYRKVSGTRKTARTAMYGSKAKQRTLTGVSEVPVKLIHSVESIDIKMTTLMALESNEGEKQRLGEQEVAREVAECRQLQDNLRKAAVFSAFGLGAIYADTEGNLLPSSSGAVTSIDYGIPAGNKNQLDVFGAGAIIGASWATAGTDILGDIQALHDAAIKLTGYPLAHAIYGQNILGYLTANTAVKELINRDDAMRRGAIAGRVPNGLFELNWWPGYRAFYEDDNGTNQSFVGADNIIFLPEPDPTWWEWLNGTYPVPNSISLGSDLSAILGNFTVTPGMFAYASVQLNPPGAEMVYGDTFLPVIKVPNAVFVADVTP